MGREFIRALAVLFAIGLAAHPAHAGDRKSGTSALHNAKGTGGLERAMLASESGRSIDESRRSRGSDAFSYVSLGDVDQPKTTGPAPPSERKKLTFFRFGSKFGDVSVQPVIGAVKGAQLSLGF